MFDNAVDEFCIEKVTREENSSKTRASFHATRFSSFILDLLHVILLMLLSLLFDSTEISDVFVFWGQLSMSAYHSVFYFDWKVCLL